MWWLWSALIVLGLALLLYLVVVFFFNFAIRRKPDDNSSAQRPQLPMEVQQLTDSIERGKAYVQTLPNLQEWTTKSNDGLKLKALYIPAEVPSERVMLLVHGYTSSRLEENANFVRFYHERGFHLLLPDNRAHGRSEGTYIGFGWLDRLDLLVWIDVLLQRIGPNCRIGLHGTSMGAAAVMMVGGETSLPSNVRAIVEDCGYTSVYDEFRHQLKNIIRLPWWPLLPLVEVYSKYKAGYGFREASALKQVKRVRVPMLFIHGLEDKYVPTSMVYPLYNACPTPKDLFLVPKAGHACSYTTDPIGYEARLQSLLLRSGLLNR